MQRSQAFVPSRNVLDWYLLIVPMRRYTIQTAVLGLDGL
jgi:hypothetical protein